MSNPVKRKNLSQIVENESEEDLDVELENVSEKISDFKKGFEEIASRRVNSAKCLMSDNSLRLRELKVENEELKSKMKNAYKFSGSNNFVRNYSTSTDNEIEKENQRLLSEIEKFEEKVNLPMIFSSI